MTNGSFDIAPIHIPSIDMPTPAQAQAAANAPTTGQDSNGNKVGIDQPRSPSTNGGGSWYSDIEAWLGTEIVRIGIWGFLIILAIAGFIGLVMPDGGSQSEILTAAKGAAEVSAV
jgi:hypothetical protein